jgi:hypothetical protein
MLVLQSLYRPGIYMVSYLLYLSIYLYIYLFIYLFICSVFLRFIIFEKVQCYYGGHYNMLVL